MMRHVARAAVAAAALTLTAGCAIGVTPATPNPDGLGPLRVVTVDAGGRTLRLAVASDLGRGLAGVDGLGRVDGMLFDYGREVAPAAHPFWMAGVRFSLEIAFFDGRGELVDRVTMEPCAAGPDCPTHVAAAPFRWVVETPPGTVEPGARLTVAGP